MNDDDNLYYLFKDKPKDMFDQSFEPKLNKPDWINSTFLQKVFQEFMQFNELSKGTAKKSRLDTVQLERRLLSILNSVEECLMLLENRRHNSSSGSF